MRQRWLYRSTSALVIGLFTTSALAAPAGMGSAGLLSGGQRFGIDQDGNIVRLTPSPAAAPAADRTEAPVLPAAQPQMRTAARYGLDQNAVVRKIATVSVPAPPVAVARATPRAPATPPVSPVSTPAAPVRPEPTVVAAVRNIPVAPVAPPTAIRTHEAAPAPPRESAGIMTRITTYLTSLFSGSAWAGRSQQVGTRPAPVAPAAPSPGPAAPVREGGVPATVARIALPPRPVAARPAAVAAVDTPRPASARYSLLIDSMAVRRAAHPVKEKLVQNGIAIVDSRSEKSPTEVFRLVVGTFPSLDQARNCLQRVSPKLKQAYLMSHNGSHGVYCGSFYKEAKAREKLAQYQRSGVHLTLRRDNVSVTRTTILAGSYLSRDEARDISLRLRGLGIPAAIVSGAESLAELRTGPKRDKAA